MPSSSPSFLSLAGWMLLMVALAWAGRAVFRPDAEQSWWRWWVLLGAVMLCFRWPVISLAHELYPDESQLLAGALTLRHDPVFWRSVDGGTAGPLDYYAMLPAICFPGAAAYVAARVIATALLWATLVAAGEALVWLTGQAAVRLAALPPLLFLAFTTSPEFLHYSTEIVPAGLLAFAILGLALRERRPTPANLWLTALLLGSVPWAKLQAAPIAFGLGLFLVIREWLAGRRRDAALAIIAAIVPTLFILLVLTFTGEMANMFIPYIGQNVLYAASGRTPATAVLAVQGAQAVTNGYLAAWLSGAAAFVVIALVRLRQAPATLRRLAVASLILMIAGIATTLSPGRPYAHYMHFLTLPLTLLTGVTLVLLQSASDRSGRRARLALGLFGLCLIAPPVVLRLLPREDPFAYYNTVVTAPTPARDALVAQVRGLSRPGESLGVWGWRSSLYVETGLFQATCQAHSESLLIAGPAHTWYLKRYMEKLIENSPPVFVDAAGPGNFRFQDRKQGHEIFPYLRQWIQEHYVLVGEHDGCRVYARHDRVPPAPQGLVP